MNYKQLKELVEDVCSDHTLSENEVDVNISDSPFEENTRVRIRQDFKAFNRIVIVEIELKNERGKSDD